MSYRVGVIGAGRIGQIHADMYRNVEGAELAALAEVDRELLEKRGQAWGVAAEHRYQGYAEMLENEDLDIISVATPSAFHYEPVIQAAESQASPDVIFCEKPLANSPKNAYEMVERCEESDTELVVDHTLRFSKMFRTLKRLLHEDQLIGDIKSVQIHASGTIMRLGTHYVDLLCYLLDAEPVSVRGGYLVEEDDSTDEFDDRNGAGTIVFDNGTVTMLDETLSSPVANSIQLVGTDGMLRGQGSDASSIYSSTFEWQYWTVKDREHIVETLPEPLEQHWQDDMSQNTTGFDADAGMYGAQRMFDQLAQHLVSLVDGTEDNRASGRTGAEVVEVLVAIFLSNDAHSHIDMPLSDRLRSTEIESR